MVAHHIKLAVATEPEFHQLRGAVSLNAVRRHFRWVFATLPLVRGARAIDVSVCGETRIFAAFSPKFATPSFRSATKLYLEEGYPIAEFHLQSSFNSPNCNVASAKYASQQHVLL